ncbi:acyltransferase [Escherichia coli]|nr:acyltransferase [Escherichia coli]
MVKRNFRKDINGLRAIAVIAVVIFHYSSGYLKGGFAGVDVFFVISGFLMTSIILRGLSDNSFSIVSFIKNRITRIVPALIFIVFIVLIVGYLFFGPVIYQKIGKHSIGSLLFVSNIMYRNEAGYFDIASKSKFLLHTWSLSVEWQFYILYPIALSVLGKFISIRHIKRILLICTALSFAASIAITEYRPTSAYFMIYSRAWEMMLGGLAFAYPISTKRVSGVFLEIFGLFLIIGSFIFIDEETPWPGYVSFIPVIGAYLCISARNDNSLLSNVVFQKIGLWSYSIYLMHWPILVFLKQNDIEVSFLLYLSIVIVLSIISFELIEKKREYGAGLFFAFSIACIMSYFVSINGASFRTENKDYKLTLEQFRDKYEGHTGLPATEDVMYINGNEKDFDYILIGDSHARHIFSYIVNSNIKVASFATDSCKSTKHFFSKIPYSYKLEQRCKDRYGKVVEFINDHPGKKVIWMSAWRDGVIGKKRVEGNYKNNIIDEIPFFINDIKNSNSELYIIGDTQGSDRVMYECLANNSAIFGNVFSKCDVTQPFRENKINTELQKLSNRTNEFKYINAADALCVNGNCEIIKNGMPVYTDTQHLTKESANVVGEFIFSRLK